MGWAIYGSVDATCLVKVSTPDGREVGQGRASYPREDLSEITNGRIGIAFRIAIDYPDDASELRVTVDDMQLPGSPLPIGRGFFDGAFSVRSGVIDCVVTERACNVAPPRVRFEDQYGRVVAEGQASFTAAHNPNKPARARIHLPLRPECFGFEELELRAFANGVEFARNTCSASLRGYLDDLSATHCQGWLLSPSAPKQQFEIEVFRDGEQIGSGRSNLPREDLRHLHAHSWMTAGFDIQLRPARKQHDNSACISIRLAHSQTELFSGPLLVSDRPALIAATRRAAALIRADERLSPTDRAVVQQAFSSLIQQCREGPDRIRAPLDALQHVGRVARRFNVIIPVYRGVAITQECIRSVLATRDPDRDAIILVNDLSPEPEMARMLADFSGNQGLYLLNNTSNLGFIHSCNRALEFCRSGHVVLLNSDTRVFAGAWDEIERLFVAEPNIGTVTAMSNNATIFSYPHPSLVGEAQLADVSWRELAAAALDASQGRIVDVPTGHGFCLAIRREVLDSIGSFDARFGRGYGEENDFCMRAADRGWRNVAACGVFVEHRERVSFGEEKDVLLDKNMQELNALYPEYTPTVMTFERTDPLRVARWPLDRLRLRRASMAGTRYALVVQNWLEGGTKAAIRDIENAYGYSGRERITLTCRSDGVRELDIQQPRIHAVFAPDEDDKLFAMLDDAGVDFVLVHQVLGNTAGFVRRLGRWGSTRQMKFYLHDFYTVCPRVTMLNAIHRFCGAAPAETCARCVAVGRSHEASRLESLPPAEHRALFDAFLRQCVEVIAPSHDTASWIRRVFPDIVVTVAPHPQYGTVFPERVREGEPNQIVLIGAIGRHKGSRRLLELAEEARLLQPNLRFHVVGYTDIDEQLRAVGNVAITGPYQSEDLRRLIDQTGSRVALFLHEWPETFSYTLTEAWAAGLWPIVPRLGAPAERVTDEKNGSVVDDIDIQKLVDILVRLGTTYSNGPALEHVLLGVDAERPADREHGEYGRIIRLFQRRHPG